jgi:hypothetical protein
VRSRNLARSFAILALGGATVGACAFIDQFPDVKPDPIDETLFGASGGAGAASSEPVMCTPDLAEACYGGPPGTEGKGPCVGGVKVCNASGIGFGPCAGEILPSFESCATEADENCDAVGCVGVTAGALSLGESAAQAGAAVAVFSDVVAVAGSSSGPMKLGGSETTELGDPGIDDTFLAKFDTSLSPLWSHRFSDSSGHGIAFAPKSGDVVLVGSARGDVDFGGGALPSAGPAHQDAFVARFSAAGAHRSSQRYGDGPGDQRANAVAALGNGDAVITGELSGELDCKNGTTLKSAGGADIFVGRIDETSKLIWCKRFGDAAEQQGTAVAVAPGGDVLVAGSFSGSIDFGDGPRIAAGQTFLFVARFSPTGEIVWSKAYGSQGYARATGVAVDPGGDILITGYFKGLLKFTNKDKHEADKDEDVFLARLDPDGNHRWSLTFGDALDQKALGVSVDAAGNALIAGSYAGDIDFSVNPPLAAGSGLNVFIAKLDPEGKSIWARGLGGSGDQIGAAVVADRLGAAWVIGSYAGDIDFGGGPIQTAGATDAFLLKLTP